MAAIAALGLLEVLVWWPMARGSRKARQAASLLLPLYGAEGVVRAITEGGRHALVASVATALALAAFIAVLLSFRRGAPA